MPILKYMADTNAVADYWRHQAVRDWFEARRDEVGISAFTVADLRRGVELKRGTKSWGTLDRHLRFILEDFAGAILPFDEAAGNEWGRMMAVWRKQLPPLGDSYIGAVARIHDLTVVTRNLDHFRAVRRVNPHDGLEYPPDQAPA